MKKLNLIAVVLLFFCLSAKAQTKYEVISKTDSTVVIRAVTEETITTTLAQIEANLGTLKGQKEKLPELFEKQKQQQASALDTQIKTLANLVEKVKSAPKNAPKPATKPTPKPAAVKKNK